MSMEPCGALAEVDRERSGHVVVRLSIGTLVQANVSE